MLPNSDFKIAADLLERLSTLVRFSRFTSDTQKAADDLFRVCEALRPSEIKWLKAIGLISEIYDYLGRFSEAHEIVASDGRKIMEALPSLRGSVVEPAANAVFKQRLWVAIHFTQALYRQGLYTEAMRNVDGIVECVKDAIRTPDSHPLYGVRIRLHLLEANLWRQLHKYDKAEAACTSSLELCQGRILEGSQRLLKDLSAAQDDPEREKAQLRWSQVTHVVERTIGIASALGLGWIYILTGRARQARPALAVGKALLAPTDDWVNKASIDLLYGTLYRTIASDDTELDNAITHLTRAYDVLSYKHPHRARRAAHQLALAHFYKRDYAVALRYVEEIQNNPEHERSAWWRCNACILKSRIYRQENNSDAALTEAKTALQVAETANDLLGRIDALIAHGEAYLIRGEWENAIKRFMDVLKIGSGNHQVQAVCNLHLTLAYIGNKQLGRAERVFEQWKQLRVQIENGFVNRLGARVEVELCDAQNDALIFYREGSLNYDEALDRVRSFLVAQADRKYETEAMVAHALGVSRQTLHTWRKKDNPKE